MLCCCGRISPGISHGSGLPDVIETVAPMPVVAIAEGGAPDDDLMKISQNRERTFFGKKKKKKSKKGNKELTVAAEPESYLSQS